MGQKPVDGLSHLLLAGLGGLGYVVLDPEPDKRREGGFIDLVALVQIYCPRFSQEHGVEELLRVAEARTLNQGQSDPFFQDASDANNPIVLKDGRAHGVAGPFPLHLLDNIGVGIVDEFAEPRKRCAPPIGGLSNHVIDEFGWVWHSPYPLPKPEAQIA